MTEFAFLLAGVVLGAMLAYVVASRARRPPAAPPEASSRPRSESERNELVGEVLDRLSEGVVVFNEVLRPVLANRAARGLLEVADTGSVPIEILSLARRAVAGSEAVEEIIDVWIRERVSLRVRAVPLEDHGGVILTLEDVTGEQQIQRVRRQFVTHASHEMKSPVASIQALAEAIDDAVENDPQRVEAFAERLRGETGRLAHLVEDLLDLSRVEDPASFSGATTDLGKVVATEVDRAASSARASEVSLSTEVAPRVLVRGDEKQLALLVRNLLDNAIRYTPAGGSVGVEVESSGDEGIVRVVDTGIGIPLSSQGRVFERFYRVDEARSREEGGTGLGLAIVKHIADLHGGRVEVQSVYGEGSTFTARLPLMDRTAAGADI